MRDLLKEGDCVVFYNLDRGFRSVYDFSRTVPFWQKEGISVHLVTEGFNMNSANGKLMGNILAAFAQWKSDMISERTKAVLADKKNGGQNAPLDKTKWLPSEELKLLRTPTKPTETPVPGKIYHYLRVSHVESAKSGLSIEAQRKAAIKYTNFLMGKRPELSMGTGFVENAVSAYKNLFFDRPAVKEMMSFVKPGDHIVFARLDRAWRGLKDMLRTLEKLRELEVTAHFIDMMLDTSSTTGDIFLQIMCMLAEWESKVTSEKICSAKKIAMSRGIAQWGEASLPTGFMSQRISTGDRIARIDPREVHILQWIDHMRTVKGWTFDKISDELERQLAAFENRKPIPASGIYSRKGKITYKKRHRVPMLNREWTKFRCIHTHKKWPELRKIVMQVLSSSKSTLSEPVSASYEGFLDVHQLPCTTPVPLPTLET
jgi:DNA invertase Pin-like site-specific DNA recombinase